MFYILLKQNIIRKRRINKFVPEFEAGNNKKYGVEAIQDSIVYIKETNRHLLKLYYFIVQKNYPKKENIWKLSLAVMYFWKMVSTFHKNYLEKLIKTSIPLNSTSSIVKSMFKLSIKQK